MAALKYIKPRVQERPPGAGFVYMGRGMDKGKRIMTNQSNQNDKSSSATQQDQPRQGGQQDQQQKQAGQQGQKSGGPQSDSNSNGDSKPNPANQSR